MESPEPEEVEEGNQLVELIIKSYDDINNEQYEEALSALSVVEQILKAEAASGRLVDKNLVTTTLHNVAFCFQR